jgi:hypothetical protein
MAGALDRVCLSRIPDALGLFPVVCLLPCAGAHGSTILQDTAARHHLELSWSLYLPNHVNDYVLREKLGSVILSLGRVGQDKEKRKDGEREYESEYEEF